MECYNSSQRYGHGRERPGSQKSNTHSLFEDFAKVKATENLGYFITVTTLENIGDGKINEQTGGVIFPVAFSGISWKMFKGEVLHGVVHKVHKFGVLLRSGPCENIWLSHQKMPGYKYINGEHPSFVDQNMSKIQIGTKIHYIVLDIDWKEEEKEFLVLANMEGDNLGPF